MKIPNPALIYGISTPETAKFAAAMSIAARVYAPWQPQQSAIYLKASQRAWDYLQSSIYDESRLG